MKIVGFESGNGLRLGVVEGEHVIDLNAVDSRLSNDLGTVLRDSDGNLAPLTDLAKRAPASPRKPLRGLTYALPVAHPGKVVCLGLNYLEHVKEGPNRAKHPRVTSLVAHEGPIVRPLASETLDYEGELILSSSGGRAPST